MIFYGSCRAAAHHMNIGWSGKTAARHLKKSWAAPAHQRQPMTNPRGFLISHSDVDILLIFINTYDVSTLHTRNQKRRKATRGAQIKMENSSKLVRFPYSELRIFCLERHVTYHSTNPTQPYVQISVIIQNEPHGSGPP